MSEVEAASAPGAARPARYRTLDAWRGLASVAVFLFHLDLKSEGSPFRFGWLGVPVFFVVSGYCLAAALRRAAAEGTSPRVFAWRRARRILPPYLASVVLATLLMAGVLCLQKGPAHAVEVLRGIPARFWLENLTLTQWVRALGAALAGRPFANPSDNPAFTLNGVYWSLGYEEQFYALMTAALLLARRVRPAVTLALVTLLSLAAGALLPGFTGLFTDYWLQFAVGLVLFVRLHASSRAGASALDAALALGIAGFFAGGIARGELPLRAGGPSGCFQLALCCGVALALARLHPLDARCSDAPLGRALDRIGEASYSLYLVHVPVITFVLAALGPARRREGQAVLLVLVPLVTLVFHRLFERTGARG